MSKKTNTTTPTPETQAVLAASPARMAWNELFIDPAANTRQIPHTEAQIADLMKSIAANGQAQRVLVAECFTTPPEGTAYAYQVVAGYGRAEALHRLYGATAEILVDILPPGSTALDLDLLSAAENYARVDPSPMDKAGMLKRVVETYKLSAKAAGDRLGFHRNLTESLTKLWVDDVQSRPRIQEMLASGEVGLRAVSDIARETDPVRRGKLLDAIQDGHLTGTQALAKLDEWKRKDAEKADEVANAAGGPEEDGQPRKKSKALTLRTFASWLEELEPVAPEDNPEEAVYWDVPALVANLIRVKVLPGKLSPAKFAAAVAVMVREEIKASATQFTSNGTGSEWKQMPEPVELSVVSPAKPSKGKKVKHEPAAVPEVSYAGEITG
jgi:ParB-like chromosome segregation protein Spo0J